MVSVAHLLPRLIQRLRMRCAYIVVMIAALVAQLPAAHADLLFEGYSKVLLDGAHIGYVVQRYEFDPKKKEFSTTYFLKTNQLGGNITESLKARSSDSMRPIAYQYTELSGDKARTIDATFKGETMTAVVRDGGKQTTLTKKVPKSAFLASFLAYMMLQGKEGIKKGVRYQYQAVAEEDGNLYTGDASITTDEVMNGVNAFKVLNTFKGMQFASWVTHKGEVLATRSPVQKIATELVGNMNDAIAGIGYNPGNLSMLFGSVPKGKENVIARRAPEAPAAKPAEAGAAAAAPPAAAATESTSAQQPSPQAAEPAQSDSLQVVPGNKKKFIEVKPTTSDNPKTEGIPGGEGVMLKGGEGKAAPVKEGEKPAAK